MTFVPDAANPLAEGLREGEAGVRMLGVDPGAQGPGAGRALTVACLERAASLGRSGVFVHMAPTVGTAHWRPPRR